MLYHAIPQGCTEAPKYQPDQINDKFETLNGSDLSIKTSYMKYPLSLTISANTPRPRRLATSKLKIN